MNHILKSKIVGGLAIVLAAGVIWGFSSLESNTAAKNPPATESGTMMVPASFSELAKKAQPGVVNIRTVKTVEGGGRVFRHFFGNPFERKNPFDEFGPFFDDRGPGGPVCRDRLLHRPGRSLYRLRFGLLLFEN